MSEAIHIDLPLIDAAAKVLEACRGRGLKLATAESCTGGLLAAALTAVQGSSDVFERGFVTYSNTSKSEMLGVPYWLIERHGAVSEDVVRAMAGGALLHAQAHLAVAITGIAGPSGGTPEKPVGLVYFAAGFRDHAARGECVEFGAIGRGEIRRRSVERALDLLRSML
jgi:nicotinamide-nucleotide amidase